MKPVVVVTGISGNLGMRLLPLLEDYDVIGVDIHPPETSHPLRFVSMDLGLEESCRELMLLLRDSHAIAVIHLAFVMDPIRTGILDPDRMWRINVAGTARVLEAVGEGNRNEAIVQKVIIPSSATIYGPDIADPANEESEFAAHTLPYAIHKMEVEKVIQQRSPSLRGCSVYSLRAHIFAGSSMQNYVVDTFRGTPKGKRARKQNGKKVSCLLPMGERYLENRVQFIHVDDMARLITHIIQKTEPETQRLTILNVAGRGEPVSMARCLEISHVPCRRLPGMAAFEFGLRMAWRLGISAVPPEAAPYIAGQHLVDTQRLQEYLKADHEKIIRYTSEEAFEDCFAATSPETAS